MPGPVIVAAPPDAALSATAEPRHGRASSLRWWVLSSTCLGALLASLNTSTLVIALPALIRSLDTSVLAATWILLAYILAQTAAVLSVGRFGDMLGRKRLYVVGFASFSVLALACGLGSSAPLLIVLRVLAGLSAALIIATSGALVTDAFPRRQLGFALGINSMVVAVGAAIGPVLGGFLVGFGWRWVFWFNVPLGVVGTVWAARVLREPRWPRAQRQIDWVGNALFLLAMTGLLLALSMGGLEGWTNPAVLIGGLGFVVAAPLFLLVEGRVPAPLLDLRLFRNRLFAVANLTQFVNGTGRIGLLFLLVFYFQGPQGHDAVTAGVLTVPLAAVMILVAPISGLVSDRVGSRLPSSIGIMLTGLGLLGMAVTLRADSPYWLLAVWMTVTGAGTGLFQSPNAGAIMGSVSAAQRGVASGIRTLGSFSGVMISIAFVLAIVTSSLPRQVTLRIFSGVSSGVAPGEVAAFVNGMRLALGVLALVSLLTVPLSLQRGEEERHRPERAAA